jgi:uncharacterized protein (TIGR00297 family)
MDFLFGFLGSFLVAFPAYLKKKLSLSGLLGALVIGTGMYGFGTALAWTMMILFFLSSTFISTKSKRKSERQGRTMVQVFANAGMALLMTIFFTLTTDAAWLMIAIILLAGSTSDTWGSEIGTAAKGNTFYITNLQRVPPGISGGVSLIGTLASAGGSLFIAIAAVGFNMIIGTPSFYKSYLQDGLLIAGMGFLVTILDSYLGALLQAKYQLPKSDEILEDKTKNARLVSGISLINNDVINFLSTAIVAIISAFFLFA